MEIGIIEGAIALKLKHYKAHWPLTKNRPFIFSWNLHSLKSERFGTFCEGFKSESSLFFLNVIYYSALEQRWLIHSRCKWKFDRAEYIQTFIYNV